MGWRLVGRWKRIKLVKWIKLIKLNKLAKRRVGRVYARTAIRRRDYVNRLGRFIRRDDFATLKWKLRRWERSDLNVLRFWCCWLSLISISKGSSNESSKINITNGSISIIGESYGNILEDSRIVKKRKLKIEIYLKGKK